MTARGFPHGRSLTQPAAHPLDIKNDTRLELASSSWISLRLVLYFFQPSRENDTEQEMAL